MYIPRHFVPSDEAAQEFLAQIESGHLVAQSEKGIIAALIPLVYSPENNAFYGHIAKQNDLSSAKIEQEALLISALNETYISPTWYASKEEHHKVVPTWDYMLVHAYGELIIHNDPEWIFNQVNQLTNRFEADMQKPWNVEQAPADYIEGQIRAIVGIELKLTRIETSFKMSQNKTIADLDGLTAGLRTVEKDSIADRIDSLRPEDKR